MRKLRLREIKWHSSWVWQSWGQSLRQPDSKASVPPLKLFLASLLPLLPCFAYTQGCGGPVRISSLQESSSALRSVGALPTCCSPHSGGHLQLRQTGFPVSKTNTCAFLPQGFLCPQRRVRQAASAGELMYPGATLNQWRTSVGFWWNKYEVCSTVSQGGTQKDWAPVGHSYNLLIKVPFTGHNPSLQFLGPPPKWTTCIQTLVSGSAYKETQTTKTSVRAANNVSLALGVHR